MSRRMPAVLLWVVLGLTLALAPVACGGDDDDGGNTPDANSPTADAMTTS